jgi:hypothetical protein
MNNHLKRILPNRGDRQALHGPRELEVSADELEVLAVRELEVLALRRPQVHFNLPMKTGEERRVQELTMDKILIFVTLLFS